MSEAGPDLGLIFDSVAEDYDAIRPDYPDELFDDLASLAGLGPTSRILEIGCGPGTATRALLARGWSVHAVEPGADMAKIARRRTGGRVRVDEATFEDWEPGGRRFAAVFSATAFHWVDPALRWSKTASVLDDGGHLALATNRTVDGGTFAELYEAARELHLRLAPEITEGPSPSADALGDALAGASGDIGSLWGVADPKGGGAPSGGFFERPELRLYRWEQDYGAAEAARLLSTYSPYLALGPERRVPLLEGMARLVDERFGGRVTRRYLSVLAVARVRTPG